MSKPRLIGLAGFKQSGKTTIADHMENEHGFAHLSFAGPMRSFMQIFLGVAEPGFDLERDKEKVIPWLGTTPRDIMQKMGTEFGREMIHEEMWVRRCLRAAEYNHGNNRNVVISDVRFANEARAIRDAGGEVWWINRPGCEPSGHASEQGLPVHLVDHILDNDGDLDLLLAEVSDILETPFEKTEARRAEVPPPVRCESTPSGQNPLVELYSARFEITGSKSPYSITPSPGPRDDMLAWEEPRV